MPSCTNSMHLKIQNNTWTKISPLARFCQRRLVELALRATVTGWLTACGTTEPTHRDSPKSAWTLFTDYPGGFSVLMPMRPQESIKEQPTADGLPVVKRHEFIVNPDPSIELGVIYNDYP